MTIQEKIDQLKMREQKLQEEIEDINQEIIIALEEQTKQQGPTKEQIEYNTWLLKVNLDNLRCNYDRIQELGEELLLADDYDLKVILRTEMIYHDEINFSALDLKQIRESIAELI